MKPTSHARHRFPADVIGQTVWLCFRFTLSFRNIKDLMAERGIAVSYETIRYWTLKFGRLVARNIRRTGPCRTGRWHLDEMLVHKRRNKQAALKLLRRLLKHRGIHPLSLVTDGLTSYRTVFNDLGYADRHQPRRLRDNNRAENSHLPIRRRERRQQRFKSQGSSQRFLATYAAVYNTFNVQRRLIRRSTLRYLKGWAMATWNKATAAE